MGACKPKYAMRDAYKIFVKTASEEEVMEKSRRRWQDNIGTDLKKSIVCTEFYYFRNEASGGLYQ